MIKYGLHNKLQAKTGKGNELANILLDASKVVAKTKGCLMYIVSQDDTYPETVWVTEIWENQKDHDESLNNAEVKALIYKALPILAVKPETNLKLNVLGGYGLK